MSTPKRPTKEKESICSPFQGNSRRRDTSPQTSYFLVAGAFFAGAFLATGFLVAAFFTGAFLAGAFFVGAFLAGAFFAVVLVGIVSHPLSLCVCTKIFEEMHCHLL